MRVCIVAAVTASVAKRAHTSVTHPRKLNYVHWIQGVFRIYLNRIDVVLIEPHFAALSILHAHQFLFKNEHALQIQNFYHTIILGLVY